MSSQKRESRTEIRSIQVDESFVRPLLPRRKPGAHKWGVGGLLIVGGAPGYIGAPALSAMAAGRVGAGIVTLAVSRSSVGPIATLVPEATFVPMPDADAIPSARRAVASIAERAQRYRAMLVGPGLSEDEFAEALLAGLFGTREASRTSTVGFGARNQDKTESASDTVVGRLPHVVIDADGLNWLSRQQQWWESVSPHCLVLTPHPGEMARLVDRETSDILADPESVVAAAARLWRQTVVLKTEQTIASDGERTLVSDTVSPSLASAGTGDVLAGAIGGLLAQGLEPLDAVALAMYLGHRAAQEVEKSTGVLGLLASDLPPALAGVIAELEQGAE